ncbi:HEAT repeat-containing protein 4 [Entophlyctis luteolus]|nr:HEAT repeat-containing protein 4 [Entophlyctis luteolus]
MPRVTGDMQHRPVPLTPAEFANNIRRAPAASCYDQLPPIPSPSSPQLHSRTQRAGRAARRRLHLRVFTPPQQTRLVRFSTEMDQAARTNAQRYLNSIAAAIDVPFVPNTRIPLVHPPPRLPPYYEAHLRDLDRFKQALQDSDSDDGYGGSDTSQALSASTDALGGTNVLRLRFDAEVKQKFYSNGTVSSPKRLSEGGRNQKGMRRASQADRFWAAERHLRRFKSKSSVSSLADSESSLAKNSQSRHSSSDQTDKLDRTEDLDSARKAPDALREENQPDSTELQPDNSIKSTQETVEQSDLDEASLRDCQFFSASTAILEKSERDIPLTAPHQSCPNTISTPTLDLLRKLAVDSKGGPEAHLSTKEIDLLLKLTLTGSSDLFNVSLGPSTSETDMAAGLSGNLKFKAQERRRKHTYRLKASGGFALNLSSLEETFQLVLPIADDKPIKSTPSETMEDHNDISVDESNSASKSLANVLDEYPSTLSLGILPLPSVSKKEPKDCYEFTRLISLSESQYNINRYKTRESRIVVFNEAENIEIEDISDFVATPYAHMDKLPQRGTKAYAALYQTLLLALLNEQGAELRFEAAKILIHMDDYQNLPRWETIAFKKALSDAVLSQRPPDSGAAGAQSERDNVDDALLAGICLCRMGIVDSKTVRRVKHGLGDFDAAKRDAAIECLSSLHMRHANGVMDMLISECRKTASWRVRVDVIELLTRWIQRIDPETYSPSNSLVGSEFKSTEAINVISTQICENSANSDTTDSHPLKRRNISFSLENRTVSKLLQVSTTKIVQTKLEGQILRAIDVLLDLMWNDWSKEVRSAATKALARLNQGQQAFQWIIDMLEMDDPVKKIDALRCLSSMGVITSNAQHMFLKTFKDTFNSVRIEACKVACGVVTAENRTLINTLLDCLNDFDDRVRAFAIKGLATCGAVSLTCKAAIGLSKCTEPRIKEAIYWALIHEKHPSVRAEAINSAVELKLLDEDIRLREAVFILMDTDKSLEVRKLAERILAKGGYIFSDGNKRKISVASDNGQKTIKTANSDDSKSDENAQNNSSGFLSHTIAAVPGGFVGAAQQQTQQKPPTAIATTPMRENKIRETCVPVNVLPDAIKGFSEEDVELYFRDCLVGEAERQAVVDQLRGMSMASTVLKEVEQMERESADLPDIGMDLDFRKVQIVNQKARPKKKISTGLEEPRRFRAK